MMIEACYEHYRRQQEAQTTVLANLTKERRLIRRVLLTIAAVLIALVTIVVTAYAQTKPPLTVAQALSLLQAMRVLDGHYVIVKQNGVDTPVMQPWDFGSGALRLRIAKNTVALSEVERGIEDARQSIVKEILKSLPGATEVPQGTPQWTELQRQYGEALNATAAVTLYRIRASELKLDRNEIPGTALAAMEPILDDDSGQTPPKPAKATN